MIKAAERFHHLVEGVLSRMAERRVAEIVDKCDAFSQVLVELQGARQCAGDLGDFDRVSETGAIVIAIGADEDLRLVLEATKGGGVDDAVAVTLELRARQTAIFGKHPPPGVPRVRRINRPLAATETERPGIDRHAFTCISIAIPFHPAH
ncbi:hypothetical protein D3C73_1341160 [compost metagenome]